MSRAYDYLNLYTNSEESEMLLAPYDTEIQTLHAQIERIKNMCFAESAGNDITEWLRLYKPPTCSKLTDVQRVKDAMQAFLGAPLWRVKEIVARMCSCAIESVNVIEDGLHVLVVLPESADFSDTIYTEYLNVIKPAHVEIRVVRKRSHAEMAHFTHAQLANYTHEGKRKESN